MPWSKLATRLGSLPLVIAGPILRQVTKDAVTVWVALKQQADVTLTVYDKDHDLPGRTILMSAHRGTTAVGRNLHIVAVTARAPNALSEGNLYFYDLNFSSVGPPMMLNLVQAITKPGANPDPSRLSYQSYVLPNFALPPSDLNKVRLIHGSCRKPHGGGPVAPDALAMLNSLIQNDADDPWKRPHQLLLTGDQIYADEVEETLLAALTDAGDTLLGWTKSSGGTGGATPYPESIPGVASDGPYQARNLPPSTRSSILLKAGFTSDDTRSHLMSLGEYLTMYLFAWSEELWTDLPTLEEFKAMLPAGTTLATDVAADIVARRPALGLFRATLPDVRRALANVPTYMICDDHEITDDWNMTLKFCNKVYANPLGRRIVQNGLVAYSLCQAWGNLPEQFENDPQQPAGLKLLNSLTSVAQAANNSGQYDSLDSQLMQLVGVHKREDMDAVGPSVRVFHEIMELDRINVKGVPVSSSSLRYNFSVEGPAHQVIVTDTRTWRWFIGTAGKPDFVASQLFVASGPKPVFLFDQLDAQLRRDVPPLGNRQLLLVFTTNAPPIATIRMFGRIAPDSQVDEYDLYDSWEFPSASFDSMIVAVSNKLPSVQGVLVGSVIFLSGDVHFSFSSRLAYWAETQRLGDPSDQPQKVKMVVAQLVASAFKNEADKTRGEQTDGYTYQPPDVQEKLKKLALVPGGAPIAAYLYYSGVAPPHAPEAYVGWNIPLGQGKRKVGHLKAGWVQSGDTLFVSGSVPTLPANLNYLKDVTLTDKPHYRYRLDFLTTVQTGQTAPTPPATLPVDSSNRTECCRSHAVAAAAHRDLIDAGATPPDCIGFNNLGEIAFVLQKDPADPNKIVDRRVHHTLRWQQPRKPPLWAMYDVSLNVDDQAYKPISAAQEPTA